MKPMKDRKMDMSRGEPDSGAFFPEMPEHKKMMRPGEVKGHKYPDTEEEIQSNQNEMVRGISSNMPKDNFRH